MTTATAVKSRPIIFSGAMVRAILEGRKTQTRRVVANKARGADRVIWTDRGRLWPGREDQPYVGWVAQVDKLNGLHLPLTCPFGIVGDRLWVRERFYIDHIDYLTGALPSQRPSEIGDNIYYCADGDRCGTELGNPQWRSTIHMPRWASRITLEITDVRVERLEAMSAADAVHEGCPQLPAGSMYDAADEVLKWFRETWDELNGKKHPWASNPWVWAISFRRITP